MIQQRAQWKMYLWTMLIIFIICLILVVFNYFQKDQPEVAPVFEEQPQEESTCEMRNKLTGVCQSQQDQDFIYCTMIDNHQDARPPSGLSQADFVFEAIVESPITRLLACYNSDKDIEKIGPVRSARPYYIDWTREFMAAYVHVGGSFDALDYLKSYAYDMNEFSAGSYFWRDYNKQAPHQIYTSSDLIKEYVELKQWKIKNDVEEWIYKDDATQEDRPKEQNIEIDFATFYFLINWEYNKESNDYLRYQAGKIHKDEDRTEIRAKNIAVIYTISEPYDDYGRRRTRTVSSGKSVVFRDGIAIKGEWRRPDLKHRTRFYDQEGNEIEFNQGTTWLEVVPKHFKEASYE